MIHDFMLTRLHVAWQVHLVSSISTRPLLVEDDAA